MKAKPKWPGDLDKAQEIEQMIRVDHAGEYGAIRIYKGQMAILKNTPVLEEMLAHEQEHLDAFEELIAQRRVRPTVFTPLWHVAGFALGAATALMGEKAAMACTIAVEETIDEHYQEQIEALGDEEEELKKKLIKFREDELHHRDIGIEYGGREAIGYEVLSGAIKAGSKLAIWLSKRF